MAWSSSRSARRVLALVLLAPFALPGCWTGHLLESARRRESSLRYERAFRAGNRLYVEYEVAIRDREGQELGRGERRAALTLADLERRPELPIDELPVEFAPRSVPHAAEPVPLWRGEHPAPPGAALVL
ncbi:MAG: hypothetical protein ACR2P8_01805, partial [Myxococcota bacterium]